MTLPEEFIPTFPSDSTPEGQRFFPSPSEEITRRGSRPRQKDQSEKHIGKRFSNSYPIFQDIHQPPDR